MAKSLSDPLLTITPISSNQIYGSSMGFSYGVFKLPTDPWFFADVVLENIVINSRYWLVQESDHSNILATGVASSTTVTLTDVPAYSNPMLMLVRVRKASTAPLYKPLDIYANLIKAGTIVYISQKDDV